MYLLDTNIFIRALHGEEPETTFFKNQLRNGNIVLSVIVLAEFYGKADDREKEVFDKLLMGVSILDIDTETAQAAGDYRKQFLRKAKRVFLLDCLLAAQAKLHNLKLVTNNRADFPMRDIKVITPS